MAEFSELHTQALPVLPLPTGVVLPSMVVTLALDTPESKAAAEIMALWQAVQRRLGRTSFEVPSMRAMDRPLAGSHRSRCRSLAAG